MRRVSRGWCVATVVGLWVCACSSDASYGGTSAPFSTGGATTSFPPTAAGKSGVSAGAFGIIAQICPEILDGSGGGVIIVGQGGTGAFGATPGVGANPATGGAGGDGAAGGVTSGGTADVGTGGLGMGGSDDELVPCPSEPPIEQEKQACEGPGICPYVDGTTCRCQACDEGWCWHCDVAPIPFGCPRVPPKDGDSCPWTGVMCSYGDCNIWDNTIAGCCLGEWKVAVDNCNLEP